MKINSRLILFIFLFCFGVYSVLNNLSEEKYIVSEKENSYETNYSQNEEEYNLEKSSLENKEYSLEKNILENSYNENVKESENTRDEVTVFISGEVKSPGVITIENGKRLYDALEKLGGATNNADLNRVNLAVKLEDEGHYVIPKIGEQIDYNITQNDNKIDIKSVENNNDEAKKININTATIEELDSLPGIGEATANKILSYRDENGGFNSIEDLKNVNGIGDKKYEELKEFIDIK